MTGSLITAKGLLRNGKTLREAAAAAGFDSAAELDLALWQAMPPGRSLEKAIARLREQGAPAEITDALEWVGFRFLQQCREAGLTLREAGDAAFFRRRKEMNTKEAIDVVLKSRRPATAGCVQ